MTAMPAYFGRQHLMNSRDREHSIRPQAGPECDADHRPIPVGGQGGRMGRGLRFVRDGGRIDLMCLEGAEHRSPSPVGGEVAGQAGGELYVLSDYYSAPLPRGGGAGDPMPPVCDKRRNQRNTKIHIYLCICIFNYFYNPKVTFLMS
jgi:hypothetical protein